MKKILISIILSCVAYIISAQSCYVPTTKGSTWEISQYDKKDKVFQRVEYEVIEVKKNSSSTTYIVEAKSYDKKDELTQTLSFESTCKNDGFVFDMQQIAGMVTTPINASENEDMKVEVEGTTLEFPTMNTPSGTKLKDGSITFKYITDAITTKTTISIFNRILDKVEKKETPAGTFDCIKITADITTTFGFKIEMSSNEWYADGIGLVFSETFNKSGKRVSHCVLTKLDLK